MKVETDERSPFKWWFENFHQAKFLAIKLDEHLVIKIYQQDTPHVELLHDEQATNPTIVFIAGVYCTKNDSRFDSSSCEGAFGFDRPSDVSLQEEILLAINTYIKSSL